MTIQGIINNYRQYGLLGFIKQTLKVLLRSVGITFDSHNFMVCELKSIDNKKKWEERIVRDAKRLTFEDFRKGDWNISNESKLEVIQHRFNTEGYEAYGLLVEDKLVFSCWISHCGFYLCGKHFWIPLNENEAYIFDAYCTPAYRGKGLQKAFMAKSLVSICENPQKELVYVTTLTENIPSTKACIHSGFRIVFKYHTFSIGKYVWSDFSKKREQFMLTI